MEMLRKALGYPVSRWLCGYWQGNHPPPGRLRVRPGGLGSGLKNLAASVAWIQRTRAFVRYVGLASDFLDLFMDVLYMVRTEKNYMVSTEKKLPAMFLPNRGRERVGEGLAERPGNRGRGP